MQNYLSNVMQRWKLMKQKRQEHIDYLKSLNNSEQNDVQMSFWRGATWMRRLLVVVLILWSVSMIQGCSSLMKPFPRAKPPANAMTPCLPLTQLQGKTGKHLAEKILEVSNQYYECKERHDTLIEWADDRD